MSLRTAIYVLILVLVGVFVLANWTLLTQAAAINLLVTTVMIPGILVGLALVATVLLVDWSVHALNRREWNRERRALRDELQQLRRHATDAEASQLRQLHELVEREAARIRAQLEDLTRDGVLKPAAAPPAVSPRRSASVVEPRAEETLARHR